MLFSSPSAETHWNLCLLCSKCLSESNRWIPRTFDGSYISSDHLLEQVPLGDGLKLHHSDMKKTVPPLRLIMLPITLDLSGEREIQICANASKTSFRVKFLRQSYPALKRKPAMKFLVVERENMHSIRPNLSLKGCCLHLSDPIHLLENELEQNENHCAYLNEFLSRYHTELRFTYDCPIRAELSHPEPPPISTPCQPDEAHQVVGPWTITMESGMCFQLYTIVWDNVLVALD